MLLGLWREWHEGEPVRATSAFIEKCRRKRRDAGEESEDDQGLSAVDD
jgi:hypothetical protein